MTRVKLPSSLIELNSSANQPGILLDCRRMTISSIAIQIDKASNRNHRVLKLPLVPKAKGPRTKFSNSDQTVLQIAKPLNQISKVLRHVNPLSQLPKARVKTSVLLVTLNNFLTSLLWDQVEWVPRSDHRLPVLLSRPTLKFLAWSRMKCFVVTRALAAEDNW